MKWICVAPRQKIKDHKNPICKGFDKMKSIFKLLFLFTILFSCKTNSKPFDSFVFSYTDLTTDYSIKFTKGDTIYLQQRFPKPVQIFFSIIKPNDRNTLDSLLADVNLSDFSREYVQKNLEDGSSYNFFLTKNKTENNVFVYGNDGPKKIYEFAKYINNIKQNQRFVVTNDKVDFGNLSYILLPSLDAPQ